MERLRIVVGGFIGVMPAGGVTWDYIQYPLGFARMGHDVFYIEDTRLYPIYQKQGSNWNDSSACIEHLQTVMKFFGLEDRWAYRDEVSGKCFGMTEQKMKEVCKTADVFINISCSTVMREEYASIPFRVLIDSDPMFTQIQYETQQIFTPGEPGLKKLIDSHNFHFSFGENINDTDCLIPLCGMKWIPTRQPVCLSYWEKSAHVVKQPCFTTLMNWTAAKVLTYNDEQWGQKDVEFERFLQLPKSVPNVELSAVVNKEVNVNGSFSKEKIEAVGWKLLDPERKAADWIQYREFISHSYAEFSVAKNTYIKANTGWFSCRSACYLAAGKPVIAQNTGWTKNLPQGKGVFAFNDMQTAREAIVSVVSDYENNCEAARQIASEYFDSKKVLDQLLSHLS